MQSATVTRKCKFDPLYYTCMDCGDPLKPHMRPIGYCSICLRENQSSITKLKIVPLVFTLRILEGWSTMEISGLLGITKREVFKVLMSQENSEIWRKFKERNSDVYRES